MSRPNAQAYLRLRGAALKRSLILAEHDPFQLLQFLLGLTMVARLL